MTLGFEMSRDLASHGVPCIALTSERCSVACAAVAPINSVHIDMPHHSSCALDITFRWVAAVEHHASHGQLACAGDDQGACLLRHAGSRAALCQGQLLLQTRVLRLQVAHLQPCLDLRQPGIVTLAKTAWDPIHTCTRLSGSDKGTVVEK